MKFRDRVRELRRVPAAELTPNDHNWRTHGDLQRRALRGVLAEIGFADALLARELADGTLELLDGHLRLSESQPEDLLPVLVVDLNDDEAKKFLLTFDPLGALAGADAAMLDALLREVQTPDEDVAALLDGLAKRHKLVPGVGDGGQDRSPSDFDAYGDDIETEYKCPNCSHEWSGKPK